MANIIVIENKISSARKYLKTLERYKKYSQHEIENDVDIRGAVERYLYLAVQSSINLAEAVISYKNFRKPSTMGESFHILNEEGILTNDLTENLVKMTGFRNIISHDYGEIDYSVVCDILKNGVKDIKLFLEKISDL